MKKIVGLFSICLFAGLLGRAQDYLLKGKIEYEKKVNMHSYLDGVADDDDKEWVERIRKNTPKYRTTYFDLYFEGEKTLYKPGREAAATNQGPDWLTIPANENVVYTDLQTSQSVSQKLIYENTYLISDSVRKCEWRIAAETRMIAGFECRRATTIIMDSIYVIAFYCDRIVPSGGPEGFNGLPGMILGLVIPRMNTTWFATKLEVAGINYGQIAPPSKGKKVNNTKVKEDVNTIFKRWGKWGQRELWNVFI
jgi:GLPGLI family protein